MKQKELSNWLRAIAAVIGVMTLIVCGIIAPWAGIYMTDKYAEIFVPCLIYLWLAAVPVLISLFFAWQIFTEIGRDNSFCESNAKRLKYIGKMFMFESIYIFAGIVAMVVMNMLHLGVLLVMLLGMIFSLGITVVCAALSHLTYKAYQLKQDNDLTI